MRIPLKRSDVNAAAFVTGMGVFPDVDGMESVGDFRAGVDRALVAARTTPWTAAASPLAPTVGLMQGVLKYRDYGNGQKVMLPTWLHTSPIGATGEYRRRTIYDDGPGKIIYSSDVLRVVGSRWIEGAGAAEGKASREQATFRIVSCGTVAGGQRLVLRGSGMDDDKPVEFRYTVTLGSAINTRLKEFRTGGTAWQYRHEYRFTRAKK